MNGLLIISVLFAVLAVLAGWRFGHQLKRKRLLSSAAWSLQGTLLLSGFFLVLLVYSNLHTYHRLTYEEVIADVYVRKLAPQKFQLSLSFSQEDKDQHYYELEGDQWQLDARILKWKGWANLIGLDSYYQLDRLSGRFSNVDLARSRMPSLHDLKQPPSGLDLWKLKQVLREKVGFVDTLFGQGVFMPMTDGAHYQVFIGQQGLIVRPVNEVARVSVY